jgi:VIT1/CCC1 family predicted Fe2+/Mn2+ transporter
VVVSGIIVKRGIEGLYTCVLIAGLMLAVLGLTGMRTAMKSFRGLSLSGSRMASRY